jgi:TonB-linked SusC/RagA family outer membrane protein
MKKHLIIWTLLLMSTGLAMAQRTLSGSVKDPTGQPLIGASVVVKGTTNGSLADENGNFSLSVPANAQTLTISYTGYQTQEVALGVSNTLDIELQESTLNELVVTAFGIKKDKSNLGYGVSQVTSEELTQAHTTNITNALAAKVPGMRLSGSGGSFSSSSILIRGYTSFTGSNQPLFVVDGVTINSGGGGNSLQGGVTNSSRAIDINQEDIESISVLKGAAATSLYGSRASNGVLLITTKSGRAKSKQAITYTANYANQEVNRLPDYQNTYAQGTGGNFNSASIGSWGPRIAGQTVLLPVAYRGLNGAADTVQTLQAYPNNVKDLFRKGSNMQHNLSFQGGKDNYGYRVSLGYVNDKGILDNNDLNRYNLGFNANSTINKKLSAGISFNYSLNKSQRSPQGNQLANPFFRSWFTPRSWDLTNRPFESPTGANLHYDAVDNPRWTIKNNLYNDQIDRVFGNFNFRYDITDWLSASFKGGIDNFTASSSSYDQIGSTGGAATGAQGAGGIAETRNVSRILNSTFLLTAQKKVTPDVDLTLVVGNEVLDQYNNATSVTGVGVIVRDFKNLNANTTTYTPSFVDWQYRLVGFFGNLTASYKNWGTLDVSVRNDLNSILPRQNNSYAYYSVAGSVNVFNIFKLPEGVSNIFSGLTIKANTGLVGSAQPAFRYSTETYYGGAGPADGFGPSLNYPLNGLAGFSLLNTAGNPNLKPEFTRSTEGGIELSLFKNRVSLNATRYKQRTTDVILNVPNSAAAGVSAVTLNAGSMTTRGTEFALTLIPVKTKQFVWSSTFNYTQFKSVVDSLAPGVANIFLGGFVTPNIRLVAGEEYGQIYGTDYRRDEQGRMIVNGTTGLPSAAPNVSKLGNPNPKFTLGISNNISFKGFALGVLLDIRKGGDIYSRNIADLQRQGAAAETAALERLNADGTPAKVYKFEGVKPDGTPNDIMITAEQYWGNEGKHVAAAGFIYNTDWFRVREATLSYKFNPNTLKNTPLGALEVGVFGRNLFLSAPNYPHLDPEQNVLGVGNAQGLEFNALPQSRSFGANLRVTF